MANVWCRAKVSSEDEKITNYPKHTVGPMQLLEFSVHPMQLLEFYLTSTPLVIVWPVEPVEEFQGLSHLLVLRDFIQLLELLCQYPELSWDPIIDQFTQVKRERDQSAKQEHDIQDLLLCQLLGHSVTPVECQNVK